MKRIISILLMFLMLGYAFIQIGIFMEYIVDVEAYTEKYCINIETPEKQCNGKCHLTEELAKTEEQHQQNEAQAPPEIILFNSIDKIEVPEVIEFNQEHKSIFTYKVHWTEGKSNSIFQPPRNTVN